MSSVGFLLTLLLSFQSPPTGLDGFHPDEILTPPGGPEVVVFRSVAPDVVSLRLSVPLPEGTDEAGAGRLIQISAHHRMQTIADRIGAQADAVRTPQALVYQVSGALADLDFLGWILREALQPPTAQELEVARRSLRIEVDRFLETPQGLLSVRIREALAPGSPSAYGSPSTIDRIDESRIRALWNRSHRKDRVRLVVAGRVPMELILASVAGLPLSTGSPAAALPPLEGTGAAQPSPEVIRYWRVDAYPLSQGVEAATLVAGRWVAEVLAEGNGDFEVGVEIWDTANGRALILSGAAYPQNRATMNARLSGALAEAIARLQESDVRRLADGVRTEVLMEGRTPWGLAGLVGQAWDTGHGPEGVESLLVELDRLGSGNVLQLLRGLAESTPIREEIVP